MNLDNLKPYFIECADSLKSIGGIIIAASLVGSMVSGDFTKPYALLWGLVIGGTIQQTGIIFKSLLDSPKDS